MKEIKDILSHFIPYIRHMEYECMGVISYLVDWDDDAHWFDDWISVNWYYLVSRLYSSDPNIVINHYKGYDIDFKEVTGIVTHHVVAEFEGVKYRLVDFIFNKEDAYQQCYIRIGRNMKNGVDGDYKIVPFELLIFTVEPISDNYHRSI